MGRLADDAADEGRTDQNRNQCQLGRGGVRGNKNEIASSTTELNYLSPPQNAWLRSHLGMSYVAC